MSAMKEEFDELVTKACEDFCYFLVYETSFHLENWSPKQWKERASNFSHAWSLGKSDDLEGAAILAPTLVDHLIDSASDCGHLNY